MRNLRSLALVLALALAVAACGGNSTEEELLEQILESGGNDIGDIDIDTDSGDFDLSFENEDGQDVNISTGGDDGVFEMTVEGEDGQTMTFGGGEVPEGMQTPIPEGGSVSQSFTSDSDRSVTLQYDAGSYDELVAMYDGVFDNDDATRSESSFSNDDGTMRTVSWYTNSNTTSVTVSDCYSLTSGELDSVCVTVYEQIQE